MAERESLYLWSTTALTNGSADGNINFAEGQLPSSVNNAARSAMAAIARWLSDINATIATGGSANAYTLTINETFTAYASGQIIGFKASFSNTGAATLNVTNADSAAIGAKAIRTFDVTGEIALPANAIRANGHYLLQYDSVANSSAGAFILLNPSGNIVPGQIVGTATNDNASAGNVGEYPAEVTGSGASFPTSGNYGDAGSLSLTAGDWDLTYTIQATANGATVTAVGFGISTTTGNSSAGLTFGQTALNIPPPTASSDFGNSLGGFRVSINSTTTYYAKVVGAYTVATPKYTFKFSARRRR